eukprot:Partr_v1_DN28698_c0_g1_i3_m50167 putative Dishevelled Associated Activator of Morphogenesis
MGNILGRIVVKDRKSSIGNPTGNITITASSPEQMPDEPELNSLFDSLLEDLNISSDKKAVMRQFPKDRKWIMIQANKKPGTGRIAESKIGGLVESLKTQPTTQLLSDMVIALRSAPITWISKFVEAGGLSSLLGYLRDLEESRANAGHEELCIKCLKSLMNNKRGIESVLENDDSLYVIACSLRSSSFKTRTLVLEILSGVCLLPNQHKRVLRAMSRFSEASGERARFETVASCLAADLLYRGGIVGGARVAADEKIERVIELQVAALSFINAIIFGGPGKELEFRAHMRYEFTLLGVHNVLERLNQLENEMMQAQISVYLDREEDDEIELGKKYDLKALNTQDGPVMINTLLSSLKSTRAQPIFLKFMQHVLLFPNPVKQVKYWELLADICS